MNYKFFTVLMMLSMVIGCANQRIIHQEYTPAQTIHYSRMENIENVSAYAFYLDKGDRIPVKMTVDSDLFDIADWQCELILKQRVYFRFKLPEGIHAVNELPMSPNEKRMLLKSIMIYLSPDAEKWSPYRDIRAVSNMFGIKGGSISFGMGITKQDGINIFLNAKTNKEGGSNLD